MKKTLLAACILATLALATACKKDDKETTTVNVTVKKFSNQTTLSNAEVTIETEGGTTVSMKTTDAQGKVTFTDLEPGNYTAWGFWEGNASTSVDDLIAYDNLGSPSFQLSVGETENVTIQLK